MFLFFVVTTVVYRSFGAGKAIKAVDAAGTDVRLVNLIGTTGAATQLVIAASFGTMITLLVYGIAPISGGHFNPAVSFGLALTKKITVLRLICYTAAQVSGAILGTLIASHLNWAAFKAAGGAANGSMLFSARELIVAELLGTALLVFVVYAAVDPSRASKVIHIGALGPLAIGGAVFAAHLALIPIDGTGINPARSLGTAIVYGSYRQHWVFWVGPLLGALLAACVYELFLKGTVAAEETKEQ